MQTNSKEWTFLDAKTARIFPKHVTSHLPWYPLATQLVSHAIKHYIPCSGRLYDIGASRGNVTDSVRDTLIARNVETISIEYSREMCRLWKGFGSIVCADAADFDYQDFDVAVLFLTLQFIPRDRRRMLLHHLMARLNRGGCLIVFDKFLPAGGYGGWVTSRICHSLKVNAGVNPAEIANKELSLSGIQRPLSENELPTNRTKIFQCGDFQGFIIEG